jgi:hypothetical protein
VFHLFNKIYLEDEKFYSSRYLYDLIATKPKEHPIGRQFGQPFGEIPGFLQYLATNFGSNEDSFWQGLIERDPKKTYVVYLDSTLFTELQLKYWKGIFPHATPEDLYLLYKQYSLDIYLKRHLRADPADNVYDFSGVDAPILNQQKFTKLWEDTPTLQCLREMDKSLLSFEYLMADYFYDPSSPLAPAFLAKIESFAWKSWFNDMEILKGEIANSFYDIHKLFPGLELDVSDITAVKDFLRKDIRIRWMTDPNFRYDNIPYVLSVYDKKIFTDLAENMHKNWGVQLKGRSYEEAQEIVVEDQILQVECLFSKNYFGLLENNIAKGFGCIFINDELRFKTNQIFPCYLYDLKRRNQTAELKGFRLSP